MPLVERHVRKVAVIRVLLDEHHILDAYRLHDRSRDRRLSRASTSADADDHMLLITLRRSSPNTSATRAPVSITSEWSISSPDIPAARLVMHEIPSVRMPWSRATIASGTVDIPTASAPHDLNILISAGVSYVGPGN